MLISARVLPRFLFCHERTNRLARFCKARVTLVNDDLGNDRHHLLIMSTEEKFVLQGLGDLQPNGSLRICHAIGQRNLVQRVFRNFRA